MNNLVRNTGKNLLGALLLVSSPIWATADVFSIQPLSTQLQQELISNDIWQSNCPVPLEELRLITLSHYDLQGKQQTGQLILHQAVADSALSVFKALYTAKFPIAKVSTLSEYHGNWLQAEQANVSYGFNCRKENNTYRNEASGKTITLNPVQNPEVVMVEKLLPKPWYCRILPFLKGCQSKFSRQIQVLPAQGMLAINRNLKLPGMAEQATPVFVQHGFQHWSGQEPDKANWKKFSA